LDFRVRILVTPGIGEPGGENGQDRELRQRILDNHYFPKEVRQPIPSLREFAEEFMEIRAPKTSGLREMQAKRTILNRHLIPRFGKRRLDTIGVRDIDRMQVEIRALGRSPKTINNITTVLRTILLYAREVELLDKVKTKTMTMTADT